MIHWIPVLTESAAQSFLHRNPVDIEFGEQAHWQPEFLVHQNPVVIEFGSESAAQSIIHWKTAVIEFWSKSAAQTILQHIISSYQNSGVIHPNPDIIQSR